MRHLLRVFAFVVPLCITGSVLIEPSFGQIVTPRSAVEAVRTEMQQMKTEYETAMQELQERLNRLEEAQRSSLTPAAAETPQAASPPPGEREISLEEEKEHPLETLGLPKPEVEGVRISGFAVGSFSYNSHIQMVPEFAGGVPALADPGRTNFRFDKFGLSLSKTFTPWLSAGASIEVENHRDRHSHGFDPAFGCRGVGTCFERFASEEAKTEINLDRFHLTGIAPIGNGLALSTQGEAA